MTDTTYNNTWATMRQQGEAWVIDASWMRQVIKFVPFGATPQGRAGRTAEECKADAVSYLAMLAKLGVTIRAEG
jgi:hypothetical protein